MGRILDPTNTSDDGAYNGLRVVVGTTYTNAQIDVDPLYIYAEDFIIGVYPAAALPSGRNISERAKVVLGLQLLGSYNFIAMGGGSSSFQTSGGVRQIRAESESIGPITKRTEYADFGASTTGIITHAVVARTGELLRGAYSILKELNPDFIIPDAHVDIISGGGGSGGTIPSPKAFSTDSTLVG
jgi:hypothetical protein